MTEYELVSALQGYNNLGIATVMSFFTVITAYLAAGYLSAHRLTRAMAAFVTAMFIVLSMVFVFGVYSITTATTRLTVEMINFAKAGKGLAWTNLGSASIATHEIGSAIVATILLAVMIGGAIGAVYFFYDCRKRDPRAAS